jgi:hypothetical protein
MISDQIIHIPQYRKSIVEQEIIDKKVKEMTKNFKFTSFFSKPVGQ